MLAVLEQQMTGDPTGRFADAAGALEREQELVPNERITRERQRIPLRGGDAIDAGDDARLQVDAYQPFSFAASI